jgi:hypothetical protein
MRIENGKKIIEKGDKIHAQGLTFEVSEILFQDYFDHDDFGRPDYFDIEFKDPKGGYHHWKSGLDGGYVIPVPKPEVTKL